MNVRKRRKRPILDPNTKTLILSEYEECKAFWQYACAMGFSEDLTKNANERMGDPRWFIKSLVAIGFRKGLPDYIYWRPNKKYHTLWIEMKRKDERGKETRLEQDDCIARLIKTGHYATYAYGCDDAIRIYNNYITNQI